MFKTAFAERSIAVMQANCTFHLVNASAELTSGWRTTLDATSPTIFTMLRHPNYFGFAGMNLKGTTVPTSSAAFPAYTLPPAMVAPSRVHPR